MARYLVTKSVDAFANYTGIVEAASAAEARRIAEAEDDLIDWKFSSVGECDDVDFDNIEPELVAEDFAVGPSDAEVIAEMLAALRAIIALAPAEQPEEEDYDDTESAYYNGGEVAAWEAAEIALGIIAKVEGRVHG